MELLEIIKRKNSGVEYTRKELEQFVLGYTKEEISDEIMTAFIKSIYDNGLSIPAVAELTDIMMYSGDIIDLSSIEGIKVDKHSTGGVGDKVTLVATPIVASLGAIVAKMSGRGLGWTGGTLDKLESIPGYNINLTEDEFRENVKKHSIAVIGQTGDLVPADKKMYALRDVTGLVDSMPLIASSIMSKKLATGSDAILLDVKCGDAAFMKTQDKAEELARVMIDLGKHLHKDVRAEITNMDAPLGWAIGNKNEVLEAVNALKHNQWAPDFKEVIYSSSSTMLVQAKIFNNEEAAKKAIDEALASGRALAKFEEWIISQGGDVQAIYKKDFWNPKYSLEIKADRDGFMNVKTAIDFGIAAMKLGAGRENKEDSIDYEAGINLNKKTGEAVSNGEVLFTLYSSNEIKQNVVDMLKDAYEITDKPITNKVILNKL